MNITAALKGPWLAVLADEDGFVWPTFDEARKNLDDHAEMTIAVVRDTALPTDDGDPEQLRMAGSYNAGDLIFEIDAYLVDEDDESLGAEARYAQAQAMADGLNAAGQVAPRPASQFAEAVTIEHPDDDHVEIHVNGNVVAAANHDEHGWSGMDAVVAAALAVARALNGDAK